MIVENNNLGIKRITVLKIASFLLLIGCFGYTLLNWEDLYYYKEVWSIISLSGLIFFGLVGLVIDFLDIN